jgi:hypothetical protein
MEATLTDAAIAMFSALMGRAHLRARKRLAEGRDFGTRRPRSVMRIATVLETVSQAARAGGDIGAALRDIVPLDMLDADAAIIRRTAAPHRDDVLSEIAARIPDLQANRASIPASARFPRSGRHRGIARRDGDPVRS